MLPNLFKATRFRFFSLLLSIAFCSNSWGQNIEWVRRDGGVDAEEGRVVATDAQGNSYVTGYFVERSSFGDANNIITLQSKGWWDVFVAKYSPAGHLIYAKSIGGTGWEEGRGIAADAQGNCYVTGYFHDTAYIYTDSSPLQLIAKGADDIFVVKFDANGNVAWANTAGGKANDYSNSITVDIQGNVYLSGSYEQESVFGSGEKIVTLPNSGLFDTFIAKYDAQGKLIFAQKAGGTSNEYGNDIAADEKGGCYITGTFEGETSFSDNVKLKSEGGEDIFVARYNEIGSLMWARGVGGKDKDNGNSIAIDKQGNSYVASIFTKFITVQEANQKTPKKMKSVGGSDLLLLSLDANGKIRYAWSGGGIGNDFANGIALTATQTVAMTGNFEHEAKLHSTPTNHHLLKSAGGSDIFVVYCNTSSGEIKNVRSFGGADNEYANSIIGGKDFCIITGSMRAKATFRAKNKPRPETIQSAGDWDMLLLKLD